MEESEAYPAAWPNLLGTYHGSEVADIRYLSSRAVAFYVPQSVNKSLRKIDGKILTDSLEMVLVIRRIQAGATDRILLFTVSNACTRSLRE